MASRSSWGAKGQAGLPWASVGSAAGSGFGPHPLSDSRQVSPQWAPASSLAT